MSLSVTDEIDAPSDSHPVISPTAKARRFSQATEHDWASYAVRRRIDVEAARRGPRLWGRASECALLDRLAAGVRQGHSGVLVIRGEAGIGKTALLEYLAGVAGDSGLARTAGVESEMELAYAGLHQLCGGVMGGLERLPGPHREALEVAFGLRCGAPPDRFMVGLAVLGLLSEAADERPQVCLVDDVQWMDQVSAQTLAFVGRRLLAERVALVFAVRDASDGAILAGLPELILHGLANPDARALLDNAIPGLVDERVRDRIVAETRGNPLALIELPRGLTPEQLAGGFGLPDSVPLASGIEQSFTQRLGVLDADTRRLLLLAAADPVSDVTLLWDAAWRLGIGMDAAHAAEIEGLVDVGSRVRFRHPLVRSAVYRSASAKERRLVHRVLADATDRVLDPDRRAWHRAHAASRPDEAVAAELEGSAARAQARGGAAAAAAFLERAAALTPDAGRRAERGLAAAIAKRDAGALNASMALLVAAERGPPDARRTAEVLRLRGRLALDLQRGADAAQYLLRSARALESVDIALARETYLEALSAAIWADGLDRSDALIETARAARAVAPGQQPARPLDVALDALALRFTEGFAAAAPSLIRALEALRRQRPDRADGRWLWVAANNVSGFIATELFDMEARADDIAQLDAARASGALLPLQVGLHYLAHANLRAGELATAAAQIDESRSISAATRNPPVGWTDVALEAFRGREAQACELIDTTIATARTNGQGRIVSYATYASAVLYNGIGRYALARDAALRVIEHDVIGYGSFAIGELAEAASRTGDGDLLERALAWIHERAAASPTIWARGIETRIAALASTGDDADRLYRESLTMLADSRLRAEFGRGHLLYGEWLRREGRRIDARKQLLTAHELLVAMGLDGFAQRASHELQATGASPRKRTPTTRDQLTPQERRIARFAADGLSNRDIGQQLFISHRTVGYHLAKVFAKLDVNNRALIHDAMLGDGPAG
jgi:DNA-binding CsgD family transcriptional regulator